MRYWRSRSACSHSVLVAAALVSAVFSGVSHGVALLVRREATTIATSNFVGLPLMVLSSILITQRVCRTGCRSSPASTR